MCYFLLNDVELTVIISQVHCSTENTSNYIISACFSRSGVYHIINLCFLFSKTRDGVEVWLETCSPTLTHNQ